LESRGKVANTEDVFPVKEGNGWRASVNEALSMIVSLNLDSSGKYQVNGL